MSSSPSESSLFLSCSWTGILGAAGLVLLTTLDDCVWLVPFVAAAATRRIATLHAITFLLTLQALAIGLSIGTYLVVFVARGKKKTSSSSSSTVDDNDNDNPLLAIIAAVLCWILAGYLIFKKCQKQRRKKKQQQQQQITDTAERKSTPGIAGLVVEYGTIPLLESSTDTKNDGDEVDKVFSSAYQPGIVISLTVLGFLDEVAYFPSLILGQVFSAVDLCIGTLLAGLIMIAIVTICLAPCRPFIEWMDRHVKMYGVVTIFAIVLTIQVLVEKSGYF